MLVSILTPTGGRPVQLHLCRRWVRAQRFGGDQVKIEHVVNDDVALGIPDNLSACIRKARGDIMVMFEDDDYYPPGWVQRCVNGLHQADAFGLEGSCYYHMGEHKGFVCSPDRYQGYSSLFCTAWQARHNERVLQFLAEAGSCAVDLALWRIFQAELRCNLEWMTQDSTCPTGIKGLPGRQGLGSGHNPDFYRARPVDEDHSLLRQWVGDEATKIYESLVWSSQA